MAPSERHFSTVGVVAAISGAAVSVVARGLHPMTPPHETQAAFTDYAAQSGWAAIHLGELLGVLLMSTAMIALAWRLRRGAAGAFAVLAGAATGVFAAVYVVFTAVDGVALGILVERWTSAGSERQELLYETAFAVRQIEGGLFSMQWLVFGLAAALFAAAFLAGAGAPAPARWTGGMGALSAIVGLGAVAFAVAQAHEGYTQTSMAFQAGLYPGFVWILAVALFLRRHPVGDATVDGKPRQEDELPSVGSAERPEARLRS